MTKIGILTDASCDLPGDIIEKYHISELPVWVIFGDKKYLVFNDRGDISTEEYYMKLRTVKELPTTAIPSIAIYQEIIEKCLEENDQVIGIFISKKLTRISQNVQLVLKKVDNTDNFTMIDSTVAAPSLGLLVIKAAQMAQAGASKGEIIQTIQELIPQTKMVLILDTLENIYRSGRIGAAKKLLGQAFSIKPILHFEDGMIASGGQIRKREEVIQRMKFIAPILLEHSISDHFFIWHTRYLKIAEEIRDLLEKNNEKNIEIRIAEAGPIIGGHIGEKALGFHYVGDYKKKWLLKMEK
ncbi:MAG: DegV family EDD domain-containing protein [Candidatus Heimdallarchaeota archaeon]|nr:DegV family EDD domain-containing protein [Candidatus Heimdallarchaeota archaeon]